MGASCLTGLGSMLPGCFGMQVQTSAQLNTVCCRCPARSGAMLMPAWGEPSSCRECKSRTISFSTLLDPRSHQKLSYNLRSPAALAKPPH